MKVHSKKNTFQPRSRLLIQLGDKLIKNENIALLELIKNSYDADAKEVKIKLIDTLDPQKGIIEIIDDGEGMNLEIIENVWLEPGSDFKAELSQKKIRTKKYDRLPIGEKGIGRFGVHKLGSVIELISKRKDGNEVVVKIDWKKFAENKYLKDANFEVYENTEPEYFKGPRVGTRIRISDLRSPWDKRMVRELYKAVFNLQSPFKKRGDFELKFELSNPEFIKDLPTWEDIKKFSLFYFKCKLEGSKISEFQYKFTPWKELHKIESKSVEISSDIVSDFEDLKIKIPGKKKEYNLINLQKNYSLEPNEIKTIGPIEFEGYIFDRDKNILELYQDLGLNLLKEYLDEQGGIRVYRENIRINEYGEQGNDWLNLDSRRVNEPTRKISNNIILGVVEIKKETSYALEEKTNREGFVENEAFHDFKGALLHVLQLVERLREIDKASIREKYGQKEQAEPVIYHLGKLKELVDDIVKNPEDNAALTKQISKIEEDYHKIQETLLTSAGSGLTLAIGLHEIEKVIAEVNALVKVENVPEKIKILLLRVDTLMDSYTDILKNDGEPENSLIKIIDIALFNIEYRLRKHKIEIVKKYNSQSDIKVKCTKRFLLGAMINIFDNSIHWLHIKDDKSIAASLSFQKKIFIDIVSKDSNYGEILIADNGMGFSIPVSQITQPFITTKKYGMGLGLHIVSLLMRSQEGSISFPDPREYNLPEEYNSGAFISLKLKLV